MDEKTTYGLMAAPEAAAVAENDGDQGPELLMRESAGEFLYERADVEAAILAARSLDVERLQRLAAEDPIADVVNELAAAKRRYAAALCSAVFDVAEAIPAEEEYREYGPAERAVRMWYGGATAAAAPIPLRSPRLGTTWGELRGGVEWRTAPLKPRPPALANLEALIPWESAPEFVRFVGRHNALRRNQLLTLSEACLECLVRKKKLSLQSRAIATQLRLMQEPIALPSGGWCLAFDKQEADVRRSNIKILWWVCLVTAAAAANIFIAPSDDNGHMFIATVAISGFGVLGALLSFILEGRAELLEKGSCAWRAAVRAGFLPAAVFVSKKHLEQHRNSVLAHARWGRACCAGKAPESLAVSLEVLD